VLHSVRLWPYSKTLALTSLNVCLNILSKAGALQELSTLWFTTLDIFMALDEAIETFKGKTL
jgi:hypothetical protein